MKIKYLGSAAYDAIPALFCECDNCKHARKVGGKNIRTRTQAIVDDDLLIDFNADTVAHFLHYGIDEHKIDNCLITHSHSDHFYPEDMAIPQYNIHGSHKITYHAAQSGYDLINECFAKTPVMFERAAVKLVEPYKIFEAGKYTVLPLPANHDPASSPVFYALEKGGKRMLYAHDTGVFDERVYKALKDFGRLDYISFDCTGGLTSGWRDGHMCAETDMEVLERLTAAGIADKNTSVTLCHFSHNGAGSHEQLAEFGNKHGVAIAYDGMEVEF